MDRARRPQWKINKHNGVFIITTANGVRNVNLSVRKGEMLGIAGLVGAGRI